MIEKLPKSEINTNISYKVKLSNHFYIFIEELNTNEYLVECKELENGTYHTHFSEVVKNHISSVFATGADKAYKIARSKGKDWGYADHYIKTGKIMLEFIKNHKPM